MLPLYVRTVPRMSARSLTTGGNPAKNESCCGGVALPTGTAVVPNPTAPTTHAAHADPDVQ